MSIFFKILRHPQASLELLRKTKTRLWFQYNRIRRSRTAATWTTDAETAFKISMRIYISKAEKEYTPKFFIGIHFRGKKFLKFMQVTAID